MPRNVPGSFCLTQPAVYAAHGLASDHTDFVEHEQKRLFEGLLQGCERRVARREHERGLGVAELGRERLHVRVRQALALVEDDRELVAAEARVREHVERFERDARRERAPPPEEELERDDGRADERRRAACRMECSAMCLVMRRPWPAASA